MKTLNSLYILTGFIALTATYSPIASADGAEYKLCLTQIHDPHICSTLLNGEELNAIILETAENLRGQAVEICELASKKSNDIRFSEMAAKLASAKFVLGPEGDCKGTKGENGASGAEAYTNIGDSVIYLCRAPTLDILLHETVHLTQKNVSESKRVECQADEYMILATFLARGTVEHGFYDVDTFGRAFCAGNIALEQRLAAEAQGGH